MSQDDCLFCRMVAGEVTVEKILENQDFIAIRDIYPKAPVHALVIPRFHIDSLNDIGQASPELCKGLLQFLVEVADSLGVKAAGYRVINNVGSGGGQVIFHLHWHLLSGAPVGFDMDSSL